MRFFPPCEVKVCLVSGPRADPSRYKWSDVGPPPFWWHNTISGAISPYKWGDFTLTIPN